MHQQELLQDLACSSMVPLQLQSKSNIFGCMNALAAMLLFFFLSVQMGMNKIAVQPFLLLHHILHVYIYNYICGGGAAD